MDADVPLSLDPSVRPSPPPAHFGFHLNLRSLRQRQQATFSNTRTQIGFKRFAWLITTRVDWKICRDLLGHCISVTVTLSLFNEYLEFSDLRIYENRRRFFFIVEILRIYDEKKEIDQL